MAMLLPLVTGLLISAGNGPTLTVPAVEPGEPAAGKRVAVTAREYDGADVRHTLFLPSDWSADRCAAGARWPVVVEYTGNYFPAAGSTGEVEDAGLGYGLSGGRFIWVVLPYVKEGGETNEVTWWGDVEATLRYAKVNVPRICEQFGGDPKRVLLCGFSRGAIGVNFLGLHDDEVAGLWAGFVSHDHYDGVKEWRRTDWGSPLAAYREAAAVRLERLAGRPVLVCQNGSTNATRQYLSDRIAMDRVTCLDVNTRSILGAFPNETAVHPHTDRWLLKPSAERDRVWQWVDEVVGSRLAASE